VCFETLFTSGVGLATSIGAGLGVVAVGYLLDGRARVGATIAGALAGSVVGAAIALSTDKGSDALPPFLWVGPVLGATLVYALSDAFFPDPTRIIAPDEKEEEDEYARVLPMISTTRTGGIIGGIVGQF
jgi:MFS family permease